MAVVRTVAGDIAPDDLGITLCHEHLLIDLKRVFVEPDEPDAKVMAHRAVELETLGWIRSNYVSNLDNLGLYVENEVIEEIKLYQKVGGATLVEGYAGRYRPQPRRASPYRGGRRSQRRYGQWLLRSWNPSRRYGR